MTTNLTTEATKRKFMRFEHRNMLGLEDWIVNKLIMTHPKEFRHIESLLKEKVSTLPDLYKRSLRWDIEEALNHEMSLVPLGIIILSKNFIH